MGLDDDNGDDEDVAELRRAQGGRRKVLVLTGLAAAVVVAGFAVARCGTKTATMVSAAGSAESASAAVAMDGRTAATLTPVDAAPQESAVTAVLLRVERVEVAAAGRGTWDPPAEPWDPSPLCTVANVAAAIASGGASAAKANQIDRGCRFVLGLIAGREEKHGDEPDLVVSVATSRVTYRSYVAVDQGAVNFGSEFIVPLDALDAAGIVISVTDVDRDDRTGQLVGSVRLTREQLVSALRAGVIIDVHEPGSQVTRLEVLVSHARASVHRDLKVDVKKGGATLERFPVAAGERFRIKASGEYSVRDDKEVGPSGYAPPYLVPYNLDVAALSTTPHAGAVALLGTSDAIFAIPVGPCATFTAPVGGTLWLGVNDRDTSNNEGSLAFRVERRSVSATDWLTPGQVKPCS